MKNTIRYIDDNTAIVTKAFQKKASIYGTDEFKLWREYKAQFPDAVMTTKEIKKNPNKKTSTKNMTYENMALFIKEQDNAVALMADTSLILGSSRRATMNSGIVFSDIWEIGVSSGILL